MKVDDSVGWGVVRIVWSQYVRGFSDELDSYVCGNFIWGVESLVKGKFTLIKISKMKLMWRLMIM